MKRPPSVMRLVRASLLVVAILLLAWSATAPEHTTRAQDTAATCVTGPASSPDPSAAPLGPRTETDSRGGTVRVVEVLSGADPAGVAIDATDSWGRVFVADRGADQVTVAFGRSPGLTVDCHLPVGSGPQDVAVDAETGTVLVTLTGAPRIVLLDGRSDPTRLTGWLDLPAVPGRIVLDPDTRQAWVTFPESGQVGRLDPVDAPGGSTSWTVGGLFPAGSYPTFLAIDPERDRLVVSAQGQPPSNAGDSGRGEVLTFDISTGEPVAVGESIEASVPTGIEIDPVTGTGYVLENGADRLATIRWPDDPSAAANVIRAGLPGVDQTQTLNPVDLVYLPATRELVLTYGSTMTTGEGHLDVFQLSDTGVATFDRSIPSARRTRGITMDPSTGRVFVTQVAEGRLASYELDEPSVPAPPPPSIAESMPGPLQVSFAPEDVARTVGLSLLILLLVGAPTPLFNETLESHLGEIQAGVRRRLPGGGRELGRLSRFVEGLSHSIWGVIGYLLVAALLVSFLSPTFPGQDAILVFGVAVVGLVVATLVDVLPGERFVARRYRAHGSFRVALWTLVLAAVTVGISRLAGLQPGYVYGIIGTFAFTVAISESDEGRMEGRGAVGLLILALVAWFARIPFEPTPGVPQDGPMLIVNSALVGIFVIAVEGLVFGLIPIRFMPGQKVWAWSRWRWAVLWGAGIALFAHVLMFPVTLAQPSPDPSSLQATLISVAIYGALAVGFWAYFRRRDARLERAAAADVGSVADVAPEAGAAADVVPEAGAAAEPSADPGHRPQDEQHQ